MLPVVEAVETRDTTALLSGMVLSIIGICACLGGVYMHEEEMDRYDFEGPPESNLPLKTFVLLSFRTELWCLKVPKKE